jgi:hypothetical protein
MNASKSKTAADQSDQQDAMGFYATGEGITRYVAETVRIDGNAIGNMNIGKAEIIDLVKLESAGKTYKHIAVASWKRSNQPYHCELFSSSYQLTHSMSNAPD